MISEDLPYNLSMSKSEKNKLIIALSLGMFLAAIESTIVTLAIPTIVKDLSGFDLISHVFSVYLLTSAIATPVYGKLCDMYGRKKTLMVGIAIFVIGCALCGFSQSMAMLIIFRAVQGIGAGSVFTVPMTIVGDVFPLSERGKVQGALSMVWGIAGLLGPFLGGLLIDLLSWHWIFFINVPFGILTLYIIQTSFNESIVKQKHRIDFLGIATLSVAMFAFLSIFILGGQSGIQLNVQNVALFILSLVTIIIFYQVERRAAEPIVPFEVFTKSSIFVNIIAMLFTAVLIGVDIYTPIYLQNIRGFGPLIAGLIIMPMTITWTLSSIPLGKLIVRFGGKPVNLVGVVIAFISLLPLLIVSKDSSVLFLIIMVLVMGIGLGIGMTAQTMFVQNSVGYEKRGAAVAANSLVRTLGQTIGITAFGAAFNASIIRGFSKEEIEAYDLSNIYDLSNYGTQVSWDQIVDVLTSAVHIVGMTLICLMILCIVLSLIMPKPPITEGGEASRQG